ncbi:hypothetical protein ACFWYW_58210 [Nonomuraea sp. NPDC059023]|uniref:hypothetical protein n=1 Tax=unclassified Nonomuraea TaxID=2593643 RepID=UPI0036ADBC91
MFYADADGDKAAHIVMTTIRISITRWTARHQISFDAPTPRRRSGSAPAAACGFPRLGG